MVSADRVGGRSAASSSTSANSRVDPCPRLLTVRVQYFRVFNLSLYFFGLEVFPYKHRALLADQGMSSTQNGAPNERSPLLSRESQNAYEPQKKVHIEPQPSLPGSASPIIYEWYRANVVQ